MKKKTKQANSKSRLSRLEKELALKKRELKIEASLEKVRASALAMKHPADMLKLCRVISSQLKLFGVNNIRNVQTVILNESKNTYLNYQYFTQYDKSIIEEAEYDKHPKAQQLAKTIKKSANAFFNQSIRGKSLDIFRKYRKDDKQLSDPLLNKSSSVHFYFYSIGPGALGISTYNTPLNNEELNLLKRFRNVFKLAYRRLIDIEQAMSQAREAQIEASLERVRAVAMSMHKSEDLLNVSEILFEELQKLGFDEMRNAMINIHNDENKTFLNYDYSDEIGKSVTLLNFNSHPVMEKQIKQSRKANDAFSTAVYKGKDLDAWKKFRKKYGEKDDPRIKNIKALYYYFYSIGNGTIGISTFSQINEEKLSLLKRFRNVFSLAYQRYSDIVLAEAQAREARIQTALERVRAVAMAMHKSEDLSAIGKTIFSELHSLGFTSIRNTEMVINNDEKETVTTYHYSDYGQEEIVEIDYKTNPIVKQWALDLRKAEDAFVPISIPETQMKSWNNYRIELGYKSDPKMSKAKVVYYYSYSIGLGALSISTWQTLSNEQIKILERFRNVFNLSYQRYVDIALAESQAREAQIEASLERVRSRTMGMQKSEELKDVIHLVYEQFIHLNIHIEHTGFLIDYKTRDDLHIWLADHHLAPSEVIFPWFDCPPNNAIRNAKEKGDDFFFYHLNFEEKNKFYRDLFKLIPGIPEETINYYLHCPGLAGSGVLLESIGLYIENFSGTVYTEEENAVLMRFGKVFQQTYTRFLDLQKAEAQARESQIQLALERVRARTMAMHKSDELSEASFVLFKQLEELGKVAEQISIGIFNEEDGLFELYATIYGGQWEETGRFPLAKHPVHKKTFNAWKEQKKSLVIDLSGKELEDFNRFKMKNSTQYKSEAELPKYRWIIHNVFFSKGALMFSTHQPQSVETINLLERFALVFDGTYTRFLDLQKAEAQAREAQIETSLERVRSVAMGMNKSEDLLKICEVSFNEFKSLGFDNLRNAVIHIPNDEQGYFMDYEFSDFTSGAISKVEYGSHPIVDEYLKKIRSAADAFFEVVINKDQLDGWKDFRKKSGQMDDSRLDKAESLYYYLFSIGIGDIGISTFKAINESQLNILKRFRNVFDLAYRRYNDIALAEAQAKEAKIEASLEKVRTVALIMKKSDEMLDIAQALYIQLLELGFTNIRNAIIDLHDEKTETFLDYDYSHDMGRTVTRMSYYDHPIIEKQVRQIESSSDAFFELILEGEELQALIDIRLKNGEQEDPRLRQIEQLTYNLYSFGNGAIGISNFGLLNDEQKIVLKRFRNVFEFAYKRYSDMVQAETQAREARIEAALERVRSKAMAMNSSEDLAITVDTFFSELNKLGIIPHRCGVGIVDPDTRIADIRATAYTEENISKKIVGQLKLAGHPVLDKIFENWKLQAEYHPVLRGNEILEYYKVMNPQVTFPDFAEDEIQYGHYFHFKEGGVFAWTDKILKEEDLNIFRRFTSVLSLTYRRYSDLKEAEAQTREAKIEASLEKVRAKAMSMHNPEDLSETVSLFFKELKSLNVLPWRCGVGRIEEETRTTFLTTTSITKDGEITEVSGKLKQTGHPVLDGIFDHWKKQKEYFPVLSGDEIKKYYSIIKPQIAYPDYPLDAVQYGHNIPFKEGFIFAWTENKLSEDELQIFRRFSSVLSLTYRRYLDLKDAQEREVEAVKQASLDRVRAEIASMRTTDDLNRITPIIWSELKSLGVPFFRCGVYIIDEKEQTVRTYLTTPDGKSLGVLNLPFNFSEITQRPVEQWRNKQIYKDHWNKDEFFKWAKQLADLGQVDSIETYQGSAEPLESLYLHFVPFAQGMLYVGDINPLSDEKLELVSTLAEAFSIAYARYEDFKNLEDAKNKIEMTLDELKSAQAQLIHSEKMASLGELTAGIAHEIKNPLNFVNNFAEVSSELIDEMKNEILNNKTADAIELIENLKQNLEKINHHGKRADSIVKGMLLHSRGTSGEKVLTNINDLLDQYVALAYHGLRAQNKDFNITIEKDYDQSLEKINVVPQDISRVFLNIVNNGCYAAFEKKKIVDNNFSPMLKVSTKNLSDKVEIRIRDNGKGIPDSIRNQIFNPFFTTKPTGEGTGLGLSLSYDIVTKVHGGDIKVNSEEDKGAEFIITLPKS